MKKNLLLSFFAALLVVLGNPMWAVGQSYLGLDGGFEGSATIDNTVNTSAQANKWTKNNATQTITNETSTVRSGGNSLKLSNGATARRTWTPLVTVSSTTSSVTIQYYRRVTSATNSQTAQSAIGNGTTGGDVQSGTYSTPSPINTWEKVTYTRSSFTFTNLAGAVMHKWIGTGGDMFIDDVALYPGAVDNTAPNSAGAVTVNNPSTSSLDVAWAAASGGVDNGGYIVVRYTSAPNANDDPNVNGIYATANSITVTNTGTVRYVGTGVSFTDNVGLSAGTQYWYKVYTYDKAYNYATESEGNGTTSSSGSPTLSAGALSSGFGNQCISTTSSTVPTFDITGSSLTSVDVTVSGNSVYTFATTSGGSYSNPLNLGDVNCAGASCYSQTIYVKFTPTAVTSYNGNITVAGGGATSVTTAVTGSGVNSGPIATSGSASSVTTTTATVAGSYTAGCSAVTAYGIEYSTSSGFANGAGTAIASTNQVAGSYTSALGVSPVLVANTTHYFHAYATDGTTPGYGSQGSFITYPTVPTSLSDGSITSSGFTVSWFQIAGTIENYEVEVHSNSGYTALVGSSYGTANDATSQAVTGLSSSTQYWYRVRSRNNSNTQVSAWVNGGPVTTLTGPCLSDNFNSGYGNWSDAGVYNNSGAGLTGNGVGFNDNNDDIILTSTVANPSSIAFSGSASGTTSNFTINIQYSTSASGPWTTATTYSANGSNTGSITSSWNTYSVPLNLTGNYYLRILQSPRVGGSFYLDDVNVFCGPAVAAVNLSINPLSGSENTPATNITLTATANLAVVGDQTITIDLTGTGVAADFQSTPPTTITILNGQTIGYATVFRVVDDLLNEGSETATFTITGITSGGTPATIGTTDHVDLPITDNDNVYSSLSVIDGQGGEAANISSLTNGLVAINTDGVQVWHFRLYDGDGSGNDADDKPTLYKGWTITQGAGNTVPDWNAVIANRKFFLGASATPIGGGGLTNPTNIPFTVSSPYITVPDNGFVDIYMRLTLETTLPANSDGQHFAFKIDAADVAVDLTTTSYSQLGAFTEVSNAALNGIDILATLQFIDAPTAVSVGSNFSVTVSAVDANGNVDTGVSNSITLSLTTGTGTLTGAPVTVNLTSGTHIFTGLNHDTEEVITITVHDNGNVFANLTANINVTNEPYQLFDDFNRADNNTVGIPSSESVTSYTEAESGDGTKTRIVSNELWIGNCNTNNGGGNEYMEQVMFNVENRHETIYENAGSSMVWLFNMRQNRSNPSGFDGNNYAAGVILGSDQLNVDATGADGYAVILGNPNEDQIRLVRFTNGLTANSNTSVIVQTLDVDADNYFSIKVTYDPCDGAWTLSARDDGSAAFAAPNVGSLGTVFTGTDPSPHTALDLKYFGMIWNHNNSCGDIAKFDNINIPNASSATTSAKLWNGSISADWNVAGNWGPCPGVPTNLQNVIIPNVATQPIVMNATPATCKDLTVNAGADLTINATRFLNVWGNVVNNGAAAFGAGTLTMEGAGTLTLTGNVTVANYHVSTNVTLNGTVTISDIARSEVGGVLASNGNLVLLNGAQLLHGVGTTNGGGSVSGNIVVKRQGNSSTLFNAWATPVVGGALPGSNGYKYNSLSGTNSNLDDNVLAPDGGWAPHSGAMTAGVGYFSTNGGLATFTGVANNGNYAPTVTGSNQLLSSQTAPTFFNLVGNPYPSAIDADLFISQNSTPLDGALYFWNDQDNTFTSTDYATYTTAGGVPAAGSPLEEPNGSIPSCQGFFVNCRTGNDTPIALNFNNGQRGGNNSQFFRMAAPDYQRMWISINNTNLNLFNQTLVGFDEFATDQKDWGVDAYKFRGNQDISIGAQQDGETYVIATYETIPQSGKVVPLMTYVQTAGTYTFVADSMEGFENHTVYLEDLSNGSLYPLEQGDSYSFNMTSADEFGRFQLWFSPLTITGVDEAANDLRIYAANDMIVVENTSGESTKGTVQITDMAGRMVLANDLTITDGIGRLQTANLANGIYAVSFVSMNGNQSIAQKVTLGQ